VKFLVTGGTGFIGWRVVRNLLQRQIPVVVGELNLDAGVAAKLSGAEFMALDVSSKPPRGTGSPGWSSPAAKRFTADRNGLTAIAT